MRRFGDALLQALHGMVRNGLLTFFPSFKILFVLKRASASTNSVMLSGRITRRIVLFDLNAP